MFAPSTLHARACPSRLELERGVVVVHKALAGALGDGDDLGALVEELREGVELLFQRVGERLVGFVAQVADEITTVDDQRPIAENLIEH